MPDSSTETRTYVGETGTQAFDGFAGLRLGRRYMGAPQGDGLILITAVGGSVVGNLRLTAEQWAAWFEE